MTIKPLVLIAMLVVPGIATAQRSQSDALLETKHFAFYSDLATNVNDALIAVATARRSKQPEPFGPEQACFDNLSAGDREPWERAVAYYTEGKSTNFQRVLLRLELAGLVQRDGVTDPSDRQYLEEVARIRQAATPAYRQCRWPAQDALNRQWVDRVKALLAIYETALGDELPHFFQTPWAGLPFRVDVVQTAGFSGANSASPDFPTEHILVSSTNSGNQDRASLEVVFHEACHFLTGPGSPLSTTLAGAVRESGIAPGIDIVHAVHFYITGEAVRRALARAGEPPYTPYLYAVKLFGDRFRDAAARILPAYLDGTRTLREAAGDLVRAVAPR